MNIQNNALARDSFSLKEFSSVMLTLIFIKHHLVTLLYHIYHTEFFEIRVTPEHTQSLYDDMKIPYN